MVQKQADQIRIRFQLPTVFSPSAPVSRKDLFAGRFRQMEQVIGAVSQAGQHVVIFGERGVGKTSLASVINEFWTDVSKDADEVIAPRINCDSTDSFETIWAKVIEEIDLVYARRGMEPRSNTDLLLDARRALLDKEANPNHIRKYFELSDKLFIVIVDEFDRVEDKSSARLFADTIKSLSDHAVNSTLVLVGVADTVEELIAEHASIDRALVQVLMPRMTTNELDEIVQSRLQTVGMSIDKSALGNISQLSQGLPHYTHLLGLHSGLAAIEDKRSKVTDKDVASAIRTAIEETQESIRAAYHQATTSPRKDNLYKQVLLSCALANVDELGYFAPGDVKPPMAKVTGRIYDVSSFVRHLHELCKEEKGHLLQMTGPERKRRFRFTDPLMKPHIVLRSMEEGMISRISTEG